ncbi:hypothetical protein OVA29_21915 [Exiguobacterium sp. SL14]|nr:hypothetical protein [Exiguobacterium sp. SL14]
MLQELFREKGTATLILKEKLSQQLIAAITPKVEEQLNQYGIVKSINTDFIRQQFIGWQPFRRQ